MGKEPISVCPLTREVDRVLEASLRDTDAFVARWPQIVLAGAHGKTVWATAPNAGCTEQAVHEVIHAYNDCGLAEVTQALGTRAPPMPSRTHSALWCRAPCCIADRSLRNFGQPTGLWVLTLAAEVAKAKGRTPVCVCRKPICATSEHMRVYWHRAKAWLISPDPEYAPKTTMWRDYLIRVTQAHLDRLLGFEDEVWRPAGPSVPPRLAGQRLVPASDQAGSCARLFQK